MITKKDCQNDIKRAIEMNKMMGDLTSGDRADYEYDRQKDDKAHRYFNALEMLKEMRKDTPLREFAELIKELLVPEELDVLLAHLKSERIKQI